jgi:hypothetical protein
VQAACRRPSAWAFPTELSLEGSATGAVH